MRNVVTLSDLPPDLHQWLKDEAIRLTEKTGKKTSLYQVVILATEEYRAKVEGQLAPGVEVAHG
jgi:hypothetical protein